MTQELSDDQETVHAKPIMSEGELAFLAWVESDAPGTDNTPQVVIKRLPDATLKDYLLVVAELIDN